MPCKNTKIITLNAKSLKSEYKWQQLILFLEEHKPDIILLQETNIETLEDFTNNRQYKFLINPRRLEYTGTIIAVKISNEITVAHNIVVPSYLQEVSIKIKCLNQQTEFHILDLYLPNTKEIAMTTLTALEQHLLRLLVTNSSIILGGDFNCTLNPLLDRLKSTERHPEISEKLRSIIGRCQLHDCWRHFNPTKGGYTFYRAD